MKSRLKGFSEVYTTKTIIPIQTTRTMIMHYRKSQTGRIFISVNSSASVLLSVISSTKQEIRFIMSLRQLNMFVKNL